MNARRPLGPVGAARPLVRGRGERCGGDRCPGALRLHDAADGPLARVRVPGGLLTVAQVETLAGAAETLGDGELHLTARGNVELRAVRDGDALARVLADAGLLPTPTHERVRNVVASPLGAFDSLVRELDAALCADPALAALSGRFLFGFDDGSGDVAGLHPDLLAARSADGGFRLVAAGHDLERSADETAVVTALLAAAHAFLDGTRLAGQPTWRIGELGDIAAGLAAIRGRLDSVDGVASTDVSLAAPPEVCTGPAPGLHEGDRRYPGGPALALSLPLGVAPASTWRALAAHAAPGDGLVRTTPWRGVVLRGLTRETATAALADLAGLGLVVDPRDARSAVGACTGRPGCGRALADVRADAALVSASPTRDGGDSLPVYLSGCERRCGRPTTAHVEAVATGENGEYVVTTVRGAARGRRVIVSPDDLATAVAARR